MKIPGVLVHVGLTVAMLALLNGASLVVKDLGLVVPRRIFPLGSCDRAQSRNGLKAHCQVMFRGVNRFVFFDFKS